MMPHDTTPGGKPVTALPGLTPQVAADIGPAGVGHRGAGEDGETRRRAKTHRCLRGTGSARADSERADPEAQEGEAEAEAAAAVSHVVGGNVGFPPAPTPSMSVRLPTG